MMIDTNVVPCANAPPQVGPASGAAPTEEATTFKDILESQSVESEHEISEETQDTEESTSEESLLTAAGHAPVQDIKPVLNFAGENHQLSRAGSSPETHIPGLTIETSTGGILDDASLQGLGTIDGEKIDSQHLANTNGTLPHGKFSSEGIDSTVQKAQSPSIEGQHHYVDPQSSSNKLMRPEQTGIEPGNIVDDQLNPDRVNMKPDPGTTVDLEAKKASTGAISEKFQPASNAPQNQTDLVQASSGEASKFATKNSSDEIDLVEGNDLETGENLTRVDTQPVQPGTSTSKAYPLDRLSEAEAPDFVAQVRTQIENAVRVRAPRLRIQLQPEELGRIEVQLQINGDGMKVSLNAESTTTGILIERHVHELRQSLADMGIELGELSINQESGQNPQQQSSNNQTHSAFSMETSLDDPILPSETSASIASRRQSSDSELDVRI
jgi:flagellar hook-length control protein FliK